MTKNVLISGCFDCLHCGHIYFMERASKYGDLYVSVGSNKTIKLLKDRTPVFNETERLYMVQSVKYVKDAIIGEGSCAKIDFDNAIKKFKPSIFIVNSDGDDILKRSFLESLGIKYIVLEREPKKGFGTYSTTKNLHFYGE